MTDEAITPVHLTQDDVTAFAASIGKAVADLTTEDFSTLANQHGGSIVIDQPPPTIGEMEAEHRSYVPPGSVPTKVPMLSFKLALYDLGVYGDVDAAARRDPLAEIHWISAQNAERLNDFVIRIAIGFGWGPSRVDDLFVLAATK